jgi:hypothetical protein
MFVRKQDDLIDELAGAEADAASGVANSQEQDTFNRESRAHLREHPFLRVVFHIVKDIQDNDRVGRSVFAVADIACHKLGLRAESALGAPDVTLSHFYATHRCRSWRFRPFIGPNAGVVTFASREQPRRQ